MADILFLPLDERPCNADFPALLCKGIKDARLISPPKSLLGHKKRPADTAAVAKWLVDNVAGCDYAVISIDMLVYGGIVPSRLHTLDEDGAAARLQTLERLKSLRPGLKLYAFTLIMRAPAYSSSEEEPDYYAQYGRAIYEIGYYTDKARACALTEDESRALQTRQAEIAPEALADFTRRRRVNQSVNRGALELLSRGAIDFLTIPLDDCAVYGWAACEQRLLRREIAARGLSDRAYLYSGADEVGMALLARAVNAIRGGAPAVYLRYSSVDGERVVPKYEDRPLGENLKWQIAAAGGRTCSSLAEADFVLMVNAPTASGESMAEAEMPDEEMDASYFSRRCLPEFAVCLREAIKQKPVGLADLAKANGGDNELMGILSRMGVVRSLSAYAAWNTAANSAGTCIAQLMISGGRGGEAFTSLRLIEDWGYMANARARALEFVTERGGGYFDLQQNLPALKEYVRGELQAFCDREALPAPMGVEDVSFPWARLFEISLRLQEKQD